MLLHDEESGQLNTTGARVLRDLLNGEDPERVTEKLIIAYRADPGAAADDVNAVLRKLRAACLADHE
ncbi:Coenzyme PQQ synthesis protein D (PqqD) [Actinopolyspora lacussalsi subsp. righensis]|uniref:Coenzyme PQQ synthesis protein D (PqqD) n=1 Tax=Actinopolyspora righensis TaxID=995060 RepID=A0A1I6ZAY6_9ACTN|nr:PqqD family peptide modification chaperone [Actinopolyspora righensis]SFT59838.1 Coenzyme PQQ synthesis protein D (PqqD) [Actinopolyspora righensis]